MYACLAVTCQLHFWQDDRGLLHATVVTRGWNGYRIRVNTQTLEEKISRRIYRDSNSRPFSHESGALANKLSRLPQQYRKFNELYQQHMHIAPHAPERTCILSSDLPDFCLPESSLDPVLSAITAVSHCGHATLISNHFKDAQNGLFGFALRLAPTPSISHQSTDQECEPRYSQVCAVSPWFNSDGMRPGRAARS